MNRLERRPSHSSSCLCLPSLSTRASSTSPGRGVTSPVMSDDIASLRTRRVVWAALACLSRRAFRDTNCSAWLSVFIAFSSGTLSYRDSVLRTRREKSLTMRVISGIGTARCLDGSAIYGLTTPLKGCDRVHVVQRLISFMADYRVLGHG